MEVQLAREREHTPQVAPRIGVAVEIERAVGDFVPVPGHVEVERVGTGRAHGQHRIAPLFGRDAFVEERAAEEEERFAVNLKLRRSVALYDARVRERCRFGAMRQDRECQQQRCGEGEGPG